MRSVDRRLGTTLAGPPSADTDIDSDAKAIIAATKVVACEIRTPAHGQIRARRIVSRGRSIPNGKYPSLKLGRFSHWESPVECDGQRLVDVCPAVRTYCEQPLTIEFTTDLGKHSHVPDLAVYAHNGRPWLVEFKTEEDDKLEEARHRGTLLTPRLLQIGFSYALVMGETLKRAAYLENARWLRRNAGKALPLNIFERARSVARDASSLPIEEFWRAFATPRIAAWATSRLVLSGHLTFPMAEPLLGTTLSWNASNHNDEGIEWLRSAFGATL